MSETLDELKREIEGSKSSLPSIPKQGSGSKFSSWNIVNQGIQNSDKVSGQVVGPELHTDFMDEVDELLLEQELLSPSAADKTIKNISNKLKHNNQSNKENQKKSKNDISEFGASKNITQSPELDSTLEKLLNGEKDLGDLDIDGIEDMSPADKQTLRKKLSSSLNKKKDASKFNGKSDNQEFIMQDISDDLNQLLDNFDDILKPSKSNKSNKESAQLDLSKKPVLNQQARDNGQFEETRSASATVVKQQKQQKLDEDDSWVLSPLKNNKFNSNSQLDQKNNKNGRQQLTKDKDQETNDIDSLVEEELSRGRSEECSMDEEQQDMKAISFNSKNQSKQGATKQTKEYSNIATKITPNMTKQYQLQNGSQEYDQNGANQPQSKVLIGAAQKRRSSLEHENDPDDQTDSLNLSIGKESQMFKDLFQVTNKQKGIAGIESIKDSIVDESNFFNENDPSKKNGPKLVSAQKNEELQLLSQMNENQMERQMIKNRSKKDLKNKYKSSSTIYNDGQQKYEPEEEDDLKGDAEAQNISEIIERHIKKEEAERASNDASVQSDDKDNQALIGPLSVNHKNLKDNCQIDDAEIDEIINQHLIEEESQQKFKSQIKKPRNKASSKNNGNAKDKNDEESQEDPDENTHSGDDDYDAEEDIDDETEQPKPKKCSPDDDPYDFLDDSLNLNVRSPKLTLIEHLRLLADIFNSSLDEASEYYDQIFDERAQFMLDFENILKIMTFDETVEYVLPCMQIYSSEQDYLKLKLFQNLEKLFKKLFKAEVFIPKSEIIDIITINIFPLASRMLMLSEEPVQVEGVEALLNLSKQYIPKEQAQNLVLKVIQVIMDRISPQSEHQEVEEVKEKAKIAILIIVQKFADSDIFEKEHCQIFIENHLDDIQDGMIFKIKKFLMPALIAVSKHLSHEQFIEKVFNRTFTQFNNDEIWGVRRVCIENLASLMKYLNYSDVSRITECIEFFKRCLHDSNRWVKNQALIQFGPIIHEIYKKIEKVPEQDKDTTIQNLKNLISQTCLNYYDLKLIFADKDDLESSLIEKLDDYSFMQNKTDDVDKIKYYWAYNLPCALLVNGKQAFWFSHLKNIYELLYKDVLINLRTTIASSFKDVIEILEIDSMQNQEERKFFVTVLNHFLKDSEEISSKVLPTICKLISKFPEEEKNELLDSLVRSKIESIKTMKNGRDTMVKMLEQLFEMFTPLQLVDSNYHEYLFDVVKNERAICYKLRAAKVIGSKIVVPLIKGKKYRAILTNFTDELRVSKHFRERQIYIQIAESAYLEDNEIFKKHFAKNIAQDLEQEKCHCVQISLARLCNTVTEGYSKSLDKIRQKLLSDDNPTILQHMPNSSQKATQSEHDRRYLAHNYGDETNGVDVEKQMTEEEWLEKEKKEISEVEKTVTIRFANYSTLMRAQSLTQGLSAQLAVFLSSMGVPASSGSQQPQNSLLSKAAASKNSKASIDLNQKILDKAAESNKQIQEKKNAKLRSLSPLGILDDDKDNQLEKQEPNLDLKEPSSDKDIKEVKHSVNTDLDKPNTQSIQQEDKFD